MLASRCRSKGYNQSFNGRLRRRNGTKHVVYIIDVKISQFDLEIAGTTFVCCCQPEAIISVYAIAFDYNLWYMRVVYLSLLVRNAGILQEALLFGCNTIACFVRPFVGSIVVDLLLLLENWYGLSGDG